MDTEAIKIVLETSCIEVGSGTHKDGATHYFDCQGIDESGQRWSYKRDVSKYLDGMVIEVHPFDFEPINQACQ